MGWGGDHSERESEMLHQRRGGWEKIDYIIEHRHRGLKYSMSEGENTASCLNKRARCKSEAESMRLLLKSLNSQLVCDGRLLTGFFLLVSV